MEKAKGGTIALPNTFETWPKVSENLRRIRGGQVRDVQEFEKLYTQLEVGKRTKDAELNFATLRRVLKDANAISERHFLDTLLPWIAGKALEVDDLFQAQGHEIPVREYFCLNRQLYQPSSDSLLCTASP